MDLAIIEERKKEPSRPFRDYLRAREGQGYRSQATVWEKLERSRKRRLAEEAAKLDPKAEQALAEEGL